MQRNFVNRIAKKCVQRFFDLSECGAQFINDATHDLTVADPAVQVFHPTFQRLGLSTRIDVLQTPCKAVATLCHVRVRRVQILIGRLKIQHRSGHFHGK